MTCHFIENFNVQWKVLATEPLFESHSGENIKAKINEILVEYGIGEGKIHLFLRDACSAMIKATAELGYDHFDCFIHKIQLVQSVFTINKFIYVYFRRYMMLWSIKTSQLVMSKGKWNYAEISWHFIIDQYNSKIC